MKRVRLFHWKAEEAAPVADILRRAKFQVDYDPAITPALFRAIRDNPPDAIVIDLSRLPSHGREVATALRGHKLTRPIPILFLDGEPEKVARVRQQLPDAAFCERTTLVSALRQCILQPPANPVVPKQMMERYAGRTTAQKLGIAPQAKVEVVDPPRDYARVIGALPEGVEYIESSADEPRAASTVTVWFVEDPDAYLAALPAMRKAAAASKLWISWPKKAARKDSLLNENLIRDLAIEHGLVDYKVCSINSTWSGLCLAVKNPRRP